MAAQFPQLQLLAEEQARRNLYDKQEKAINDLKRSLKERFERTKNKIRKYQDQHLINKNFPTKSPFGSQEKEENLKKELSDENMQIKDSLEYAKDTLIKIKDCYHCLKDISKCHIIDVNQFRTLNNFSLERHTLAASLHQDSMLGNEIDNFLELLPKKRRKMEVQDIQKLSQEENSNVKDKANNSKLEDNYNFKGKSNHSKLEEKSSVKSQSNNLSISKKSVKPITPLKNSKYGQFLEPPKPNTSGKKSLKRKFNQSVTP